MKKILALFFVFLFSLQASNAQETFFQTGHTHDILEVHFSPDDSQLVSYSSGDGRFILWDVKSGRKIWTRKTGFIRKANERMNLMEFYWSKDGKSLVTKSVNGTYQTWDSQTGKVLAVSEIKPDTELIQPKSKSTSVSKNTDSFTITNSKTGKSVEVKSESRTRSVFDVSYDGTLFADGKSWGDASIKITDLESGKSWLLDGHPSVVGGIAFTPDGKLLAVGGSDKIIYIFDVQEKKVIEKLTGSEKPIKSLSFSPDGKFLITFDDYNGMNVWDWKNKNLLRGTDSIGGMYGSNNVRFSKDGKYFLFINDGDFGVWQTSDWQQKTGFKTAENYESKHGIMSIGYDSVPVFAAAFINDGKEIVASHYDGTWRVWNTDSGKQIKKFKVGEDAEFMVNLGDQKVLAAVHGQDRNNDEIKIKIFNYEKGIEEKRFDDEDTSFIENLILSPDNRHFVTSDVVGDVLLWNVNKSKPVREFDIGFSGDDAIAFCPDGKTFAVGGRNQNLFLFDVESGEKLWQLIPSYQPSDLEIEFEERGKKGRAEVQARKDERNKQAEVYISENKNKITAKFSHYGDAESFWDQKIAESGTPNKSKLKLPKKEAKVAWFTLTNDADLPVSIDTNSMVYSPKCKGLCDGAEISSRYVLELKNGETDVNGFDMFSSTTLPPKTTVYFSVALEHFNISKAIYLRFTFKKDNADEERENAYGTEQKLYIRESDLPK